MTLYRGVQGDYATAIKSGLKSDDSVDVAVNPATSWTSSQGIAQTFAGKSGVVIQQDVPISNILLSHETTPYIRTSDFMLGGTEEDEYIVGNADGTMTINKEDIVK
jgi:hypothetical protein